MKSYFRKDESSAPVAVATKPIKKRRRKSTWQPVDYDAIIAFVAERGSVQAHEAAKQFGVSQHVAYLRLNRLFLQGVLHKVHGEGYKAPVTFVTKESAPAVVAKEIVDKKPQERRSSKELGEKLLQYVSDHDGEAYTRYKMAEDLGVSYQTLTHKIREYIFRGYLDRDFNKGSEKPVVKSTVKVSSNEATFCDAVETLIWEYVKETRNTDLLTFLTWLEKKN